MNISKILQPFLKPTSEGKLPTDAKLDYEIQYVVDLLRHISPRVKHILTQKLKLFFVYRWKFLLGRIVVTSLILTLSYLLLTTLTPVEITTTHKQPKTIILKYPIDSSMNLRNYLLQIQYTESRYDKKANRPGSQYWGLYQIGTDGRKCAGYGDISKDVYLAHQEIQDLCMINLLKYNKKCLQKTIDKYDGKIVDGILITESGVLALSHLGCGYAKSCLEKGDIPERDSNGNSPRSYIKLGGYQLNLDKVKYSIEDGI